MWQLHTPYCPLQLSHWLLTVRNSNQPQTHTFTWRFGSINRGDEASADQMHSTERSTTATAMAPGITSTADHPKEYLSLTHKIRKPIVEKLRRDRINNSIEELKALLGPQLPNQHPDSKLEKADILEMTVCLLRKHLQRTKASPHCDAASQGFFKCSQEVMHFLSKDPENISFHGKHVPDNTSVHGKQLTQFQSLQPPIDDSRWQRAQCHLSSAAQSKDKHPAKTALWRPW
ncbi:hypothetical protein ACEWY4_012828 [Coilia grayii]|uniref:BHLH domain-containing protein n=1 Tax=Coilia grayii TaxID=363190 RepID=A0ABD1JUI8_9TELE